MGLNSTDLTVVSSQSNTYFEGNYCSILPLLREVFSDKQVDLSGHPIYSTHIYLKGVAFSPHGLLCCTLVKHSFCCSFLIHFQTFAAWRVDYLKLDGCYSDPDKMDTGYPMVTKALNNTGRPIVFSCSWPAYQSSTRTVRDATSCCGVESINFQCKL